MIVLRAQDVAALDAAAASAGHPPDVLMARAGLAVAGVAVRFAPAARRVVVLAGPGNNGGDGYLVAANACRHGLDVRCLAVA
ncbi:MAG: NAD(P)H-hydrate epimerase, partial [Trueperaceae bacterium]|nr:NAD(P)H-hydrate epimerase [Trueperaceae bacterium]